MDEVQLTTVEDKHLNHILEWYDRGGPNTTCATQGEIKCYIKKENESSCRKRISIATIKIEILRSVLPARTILKAMD